jgi:hypothetical protein
MMLTIMLRVTAVLSLHGFNGDRSSAGGDMGFANLGGACVIGALLRNRADDDLLTPRNAGTTFTEPRSLYVIIKALPASRQ